MLMRLRPKNQRHVMIQFPIKLKKTHETLDPFGSFLPQFCQNMFYQISSLDASVTSCKKSEKFNAMI